MNRESANAQFERASRALRKMRNNRNRELVDYEDDVWCFFQNCWHLKDWIRNDDRIPQEHRDSVENDVCQSEALCICADLANRSKHLKLTTKRLDAAVTKRNLTIHAGPPGKGFGEYCFVVLLDDGSERDAIAVAEAALNEWKRLLNRYGVSVAS